MREQGRPPRPATRRAWLEYLSSGILAFLLATVIWVMAVNEQDPPRTSDFQGVPIQYANLAAGLVMVGEVEERASVTVRAPASYWPLNPNVLEATVNLKGLGVGVHNVDLKLRSLDRAALVIKCTPTRVVVRLEESVSERADVETVVADPDTVPPGYATLPVRTVPTRVTLSGPRSLVESVDKVVATVWLRGSKSTVQNQVVPVPLNARGEVVSGVELTPGSVAVTLDVMPLAEFRDVTIRAALKGAPAAGYWVSNITVEPAAVTIQGKPETIRTMPAVVSTVPIDVAGVGESFSRRVALELPEDVSVYSTDPQSQTVLVRVEVTAIIGGKTVQPKVEVLGLRSGLVATIAPDTVDVILSGPLPELQALELEDVRVVVNLVGLRPGRHMVTPEVVLPEGSGLRVQSVAPDPVEVTIAYDTGSGS
jgi:YbbR domain-containing protein